MSRRVLSLLGLLLLAAGGVLSAGPRETHVEAPPPSTEGHAQAGSGSVPCPKNTLPDGNVCIPVPAPAEHSEAEAAGAGVDATPVVAPSAAPAASNAPK